ncbi:MAG: hypothetical protein BJ554DRAFT_3870, partial [Olpidium bornovanus]
KFSPLDWFGTLQGSSLQTNLRSYHLSTRASDVSPAIATPMGLEFPVWSSRETPVFFSADTATRVRDSGIFLCRYRDACRKVEMCSFPSSGCGRASSCQKINSCYSSLRVSLVPREFRTACVLFVTFEPFQGGRVSSLPAEAGARHEDTRPAFEHRALCHTRGLGACNQAAVRAHSLEFVSSVKKVPPKSTCKPL